MSNFILKTLQTRELKLNTIRLRGFYGGKLRKGSGGGGSGDGFPQLPGDVTRWYFGGLTNEMMAAMDDPRICLLYTSPSPRDRTRSRMPSSA